MILDTISDFSQYTSVLPGLDSALEFVRKCLDAPKPDGSYTIDGDRIFANISTYDARDREGAQFEAHRKYADLQVVLSGEEAIGWAPLGDALHETSEEYSKGGDIAFYTGEIVTEAVLPAGVGALLLPQDAHMPCLYTGKDRRVTKIVVKIAI